MEQDRTEELIAGYAIGYLDDEEIAEAEYLLKTDPNARALLAELEEVTAGLTLSVDPVELPAGSLNRLRTKAGVMDQPINPSADQPGSMVERPQTTAPQALSSEKVVSFEARSRRNAFRSGSMLAYAAVLALFIVTGLTTFLWLNTRNELQQAQQSNQELASVISSPNLKVTDLKPLADSVNGTMRLYSDPATNKAYLVTYNLSQLPSDKEYEAWLITGDNQAHKAGLLGSGGSQVYELDTNQKIDQYKLVAVTIEKAGGVEKSDQKPILAGTIPV
ncbi:MAG TPA: anti-sigma factor [Chloroflexia bacterium]|nr:anti-sigma factor [Chloroflexia bacterium]